MTEARRCLAVVLAAGEGTRMKSTLPKVLHRLAGRTMLAHVVATAAEAEADAVAVVVGPGRDDVAAEARRAVPGVEVFVQAERLGTAHAVLAAAAAIGRGFDEVLILYADVPLISCKTLSAMRRALADGAALVALGFEARDPFGYGRLLTAAGELMAIREHKDATDVERAVTLCNSGLMALDGRTALDLLQRIGRDNVQGEYYLTDAVELTRAAGLRCAALTADERETKGVNDRIQLASAEAVLQDRLREAAMREGATLQAPGTVFFAFDTRLGRDVTVEPHVVFGPGVTVDDGAVIHAFSHLEGAHVGAKANVGPYARLRPGAMLGRDSKVGNFVEVKSATIEAGAKVSHLSYIGDASVGAGRQHRGRHRNVQLRWLRQIPHGDRRRGLHRLQFRFGGARDDRAGGLCGLRIDHHRGRAGRCAGPGQGPPDHEGGARRRAAGRAGRPQGANRPERLIRQSLPLGVDQR